MGDVSRRTISFIEFLIFLVFNCTAEKFVQNICMFFIFRSDFIPATNESFWKDSILSDDNGFTVLQNCLISRISFSSLSVFCKIDNNLAVVMGNVIGARPVLYKSVSQRIYFLMSFLKIYIHEGHVISSNKLFLA